MRRFLIILLVLAVLIVGGGIAAVFLLDDRFRGEAEDRTAEVLKTSVPFTVKPDVDIVGYPIALTLLTKQVDAVRVQGAEMPVQIDDDTTLPLLGVDFTLRGVHLGDTEVRGRTAEGTARLTYEDVGRLAGLDIAHVGGDRVRFSASVEVLGQEIEGSLTGVPQVDPNSGALTLGNSEVEVAGIELPDRATQILTDRFLQPIQVPLPYGLKLTGIQAEPDGFHVRVNGENVVIPTQ